MNEETLYKKMYYRLYAKVCDAIENAETLEQAKTILIRATQEAEDMYVNG